MGRGRWATVLAIGACTAIASCAADPASPPAQVRAALAPVHAVSSTELADSAQVLRHRLALAHVHDARVTQTALGGLVVVVPRQQQAVLSGLGRRGLVELRPLVFQQVVTGGSCRPGVSPDGAPIPPGGDIACAPDGTSAYLLGPLAIDSTELINAHAERDRLTRTWKVLLTCTAAGARRLGAAMARSSGHRLALTLDGTVLASPVVAGAITGRTVEITGAYVAPQAHALVAAVSGGVLPVALHLVPSAAAAPGATHPGR